MDAAGERAFVWSIDAEERAAWREVLLAVLAVVSVLIGFTRVGADGLAPTWVRVVDVSIASLFALDWLRRVHASDDRRRYAFRNAYEVVTFVPFTLIPAAGPADILRGVRLVRLFVLARVGQLAKLSVALARMPRRLRRVTRIAEHANLAALFLGAVVVVAMGAAALRILEGPVNPGASTFGDAFWWSLNLFSTVAYDIPQTTTPGGRIVAGVLLVSGIAFLAVFTASLANALVRQPPGDD